MALFLRHLLDSFLFTLVQLIHPNFQQSLLWTFHYLYRHPQLLLRMQQEVLSLALLPILLSISYPLTHQAAWISFQLLQQARLVPLLF